MDFQSCNHPWFEMQIMFEGVIRPCCQYAGATNEYDMNSEDTLDIKRIWNGKFFKQMRKNIAEGTILKSGCENCGTLKFKEQTEFQKLPWYVTKTERINNWNLAEREFKEKRISVESMPTKYFFGFGVPCNVKCVMCFQNSYRKKNDSRTIKPEHLISQKDHLKIAESIHLIGGEPFIIPSCMRFLDFLKSDPDFSDTRICLYTNGMVLHQHISSLACFKNLHLAVSLDSFGSHFEKIRQGASWNRIAENIEAFLAFGKAHKLNWSINIQTVIMNSGLPGLEQLIEWALKRDLPIEFSPIAAYVPSDFLNEDLFNNKYLLSTNRNWRKVFERSIKMLETQQTENATCLKKIYELAGKTADSVHR